ncbi:YeeE/YedE thiosulfate transporter family protein [Vallitalea okinawensis]|uniref:YeeE/YedE thiosulfate transporter family protein n=1 Tax=Vallitalea okinawensis TaxID=2078660 RepID=UPI000CFACF14|nr:YeeE/YedE thiosulfate transporter family protein [Vallitalea okinawensis]
MSDAVKVENASGSSSIRRSSTRSRTRRKKKNQLPIGIVVFVLILLAGAYFGFQSASLGLQWILGISFGFILQKSRFCFTASMRDPYLTGSTSITRAVLIALAVTTIGFTAIKYGYYINGLPIPGMSYVVPISLATIIGAFVFGVGMVIAGGCASGTLMRVGEGFSMQVLSLAFFVIGSLWGAHDFEWWSFHIISKGPKVFLPDVFGWFGAVVIQLLIILCLYMVAVKYEQAKTQD